MVLIICNKMCCAIGKGTELACGCTDLSFPGKSNWNQIGWRKQVVLQPDSRLSSSISSLMEHCLHFEPTPGGAGTQRMYPCAGHSRVLEMPIYKRGRSEGENYSLSLPLPSLPDLLCLPHTVQSPWPRFSCTTPEQSAKASLPQVLPESRDCSPQTHTHIPQTLGKTGIWSWKPMAGTAKPSGGVSCWQQNRQLGEAQQITALEDPVPRLGHEGTLGTHYWDL